MSNFFIDRPIFAWVIAIFVMIGGILAITQLPVEQFPEVAPPSVVIRAVNPGASAETVQDTTVQVIEQNMVGLDNMLYMASKSDSAGTGEITITFAPGTNPDIAQVQVQNKLQSAIPQLPQSVRDQGVKVSKSSPGAIMVVAFYAPKGDLDRYDMSDYVAANILEPISRLNGVGDVTLFGSQYAMRIWLDADKLNSFQLTSSDVVSAIREQNFQVRAGELGAGPAAAGQQLNATVIGQTLLKTPAEFGDILLRVNADGSRVALRDVARIELGGENYQFLSHFRGYNATGFVVNQAPNSNALEVAAAVKEKLAELDPFLPEGMVRELAYDTAPFTGVAIRGVVETLVEAVILVTLVMFLFLQNLRATLIPTIAIPVVLLGTFGILQAFGFSINTLSMFAMVLAIGLLVDDAIVVVENVERIMAEEGLSPREATRKSMGQIQGALVGIGTVLSAVFVPMAFFPGTTGAIYRQFSITIVSAMMLSVFVALILTPALCATMLKPVAVGHHEAKRGFFGWFNRTFQRSAMGYRGMVDGMLRKTLRYLVIYGAVIAAVAFLFVRMPTAFLPEDDPGLMFTQVQLPVGATMERTRGILEQVEQYYAEKESETIKTVYCVTGFSFTGRGQNSGQCYIQMYHWDQRSEPGMDIKDISRRATGSFAQMKDARAVAFYPPPIRALGNSAGFVFELKDNAHRGHEALLAARNQLLGGAAQDPRLAKVRPNGLEDTPHFRVDIDREKARALGVSIEAINDTLATAWASTYTNDFLHNGRIKKVYVQGDTDFRMLPEDLQRWFVRNQNGEMVPFSAFATTSWTKKSPRLERYNAVPSMEIVGEASPGHTTGEAIQAMEELAAKLPPGVGYEWTGISLQETQAGAQAPILYALSIAMVFLALAALYESWSIPFAVILVVPLGVIGALLAGYGRGLSNDIFFQVSLLTTVGLSAKNAILIVEFARDLQARGAGLVEATLEAARLRLRPIIMTSGAFMLGVLPLALNTGAGSESQNAVGTGVLGGVITGTLLAIFFVPVFFVVIRRIFKSGSHRDHELAAEAAAAAKNADPPAMT
ncbi:MAG: efflux RND transporter permease subunit [Gammaproteobacteria bacterium]|nr:efflux RND transporter permease subunit [Gammaproteobacteria bacterium]